MITTVRYACHTAHLDPFTGEGVLVLPLPAEDMRMTGPSLHASDWEAVIDDLTANGWQPSESETGEWLVCGETPEGREVIGMFGHDPIVSNPSLDEMCRASAELLALAGVVGYSRA